MRKLIVMSRLYLPFGVFHSYILDILPSDACWDSRSKAREIGEALRVHGKDQLNVAMMSFHEASKSVLLLPRLNYDMF